jgi:hypothetical protein
VILEAELDRLRAAALNNLGDSAVQVCVPAAVSVRLTPSLPSHLVRRTASGGAARRRAGVSLD